MEAKLLANVDQVQNILLKTRASEANGGSQELRPDSSVGPNGSGNLADISASTLAYARHRVDAAHPLRKERVSDKFGKLRTPEICGENAFAWNPIGVDVDKDLHRVNSFGSLCTTNQDAVWIVQVLHGGALSKEFGIGENPETFSNCARVGRLVGQQHPFQSSCSPNWHSRFLDHDLAAGRMLCDRPAHTLNEPEVSSTARTNSGLLRRRVHRRKYDVRVLDAFGYVGGEEEVSPAALFDDVHQAWLENGKVVGVGSIPRRDSCLVHVHDGDGDVGALQSNRSHGGTSDISSTNATNLRGSDAKLRMLVCHGSTCEK
mmetsp:Transcript_55998/g.149384  ORF Transcript_55998/g.149384 Transcript_55998/m.149384 type:complete len:317 (-) Transcript_55998:30-980(-)